MNSHNWTSDIEALLEKVRINSVYMSDLHKSNFFNIKQKLQYFRIPTIVISTINAILSVSLAAYIGQATTSMVNCALSMIASIIVSIELYLQLNKNMDEHYTLSKEFYTLSVNIYKMLNLQRENRNTDARAYLDEIHSAYLKLYENSQLTKARLKDNLQPIPKNDLSDASSIVSNSSTSTLSKIMVGDVICEI